MTARTAFDRLSEAELAHHRRELTYAQVQLCKRGEFEAVARCVRRRAWAGLRRGSLASMVGVVAAVTLGVSPWVLLAAAPGFLIAAHEYIQAKRTAETVHRLMEERERLVKRNAARQA